MIEYPVFEKFGYDFIGIPFVKNMAPNLCNDGLLGWIEFDEEDETVMNQVIKEIMKKRGMNDKEAVRNEVLSFIC